MPCSPEPASDAEEEELQEIMRSDPPVVLLVDDSVADCVLARRSFRDAGSPVDLRVVGDGEEALAYLRRAGRYADRVISPRPDIVLLDLNMPGMNGHELLTCLRREPGFQSLPVVVLTTSEEHGDIERSYRLGANAYMVKPITVGRFQALLSDFESFWIRSPHVRKPQALGGMEVS